VGQLVLVIVSELRLSPVACAILDAALEYLDELGGAYDLAGLTLPDVSDVSTYDVVQHYAERFGVDEADVLRALAELERAGVLRKAVV